MNKLVSVIIPTYNRPVMVQRAINSVLEQTYKNIELLVIDDGSVDEYDVKLPAWYYKPWELNKGGSAARNFGLTKAHGDYIVFVDDDNELQPDFITQTLLNIKGDAVTTGREIVTPEYTTTAIPEVTDFPAIDWGWLIKRQVFDRIRYDESIWGDEDADLGIQFRKAGFTYTVLPNILQTAHVPSPKDEITSNTYPNERRLRGLRNFIGKNLSEYKDPQEQRYILRLAGRNFMKGGHHWEGLKYFWRSYQAVPNFKTFKHLFFAMLGWKAYDNYMTQEERKV